MKFTFTFSFFMVFGFFASAQDPIELDLFAEGFNVPVDIVHAGDSMLYVVEKPGVIQLVTPDGQLTSQPFLDIQDRVNDNRSERGLLGLVFHPVYPDTPHFYVNYTNAGGQTVISRFSVDINDLSQGDKSTEEVLMTITQPFTNHNGGDLLFGPDGYLYIPTGDGGSGGDPEDNGQDYMELLGKMLRIDVDQGLPYTIPADNPFVTDDSVSNEIWAAGLRNPWRCDFDPMTGDLYIADVGQNKYEEINFQLSTSPGGENYGWRCYEADSIFNLANCPDVSELTFPVHYYERPLPPNCASITGGVVYRGSQYPDWQGKYFFSDFCTGRLATLSRNLVSQWVVDTLLASDSRGITAFGRDYSGEMYVAVPITGSIYKLTDPLSSTTIVEKEDRQWVIENPVSNQLVFSEHPPFQQAAIYNIQGQLMTRLHPEVRSTDVGHWSSGLYILQVVIEGQSYIQKLMIQ